MTAVVAGPYRLERDAIHGPTRLELHSLGVGHAGPDILDVDDPGLPNELFDLLGLTQPAPGTLWNGLLLDGDRHGGKDQHAYRDHERCERQHPRGAFRFSCRPG